MFSKVRSLGVVVGRFAHISDRRMCSTRPLSGPSTRQHPSPVRPSSASATDRDPEVGARIRQARNASGLSQRELAAQLQVQRRTVQKWEDGSSAITWRNLHRLAAAIDVSTDWIRFGDVEPTAPAEPTLSLGALASVMQRLIERQLGSRLDRIERHLDAIAADAQETSRLLIEREQAEALRRSRARRTAAAAGAPPPRLEDQER